MHFFSVKRLSTRWIDCIRSRTDLLETLNHLDRGIELQLSVDLNWDVTVLKCEVELVLARCLAVFYHGCDVQCVRHVIRHSVNVDGENLDKAK